MLGLVSIFVGTAVALGTLADTTQNTLPKKIKQTISIGKRTQL